MTLLHIVSSPRGDDSVSIAVVEAFLDAYRDARPDVVVDTLDVWSAELPEFDAEAIGVKYKLVSGAELTAHEESVRARIGALIERFHAADRIVLGVPMWNWSIPYKLKQLIDLVCQRNALFTFDGATYGPMLDVPRALVVGVRGQDVDAGFDVEPPSCDHQMDFVRFWLRVIGVRDVETIFVDHAWDAHAPDTLARGVAEARELAGRF